MLMVKKKYKKIQKKFKKKFNKNFKNFNLTAKKIIIGLIIAVMAIVAITLIINLAFNPEAVTKRKVESLAHDYYENYYFEKVENSKLPNSAEEGLPKVSLRQLLLFDNGRHMDMLDELSQICDTNATNIKIYPQDPYNKNNYRVEYNYSCNF